MTTYAALRALAEKATPGPWKHGPLFGEVWSRDANGAMDTRVAGAWLLSDDGAYIAAADPATILALLDDLDAAQARIAELEASLGTDEHIVTFSEDGYGLQHPIRCRPDLLGCSVNVYLAYRDEPDMPPGKWTVQLLGDGDPLYTAIAAAREGGSK